MALMERFPEDPEGVAEMGRFFRGEDIDGGEDIDDREREAPI